MLYIAIGYFTLKELWSQKNRLGKIVNHSWRSFIVAVRTAAHYGIGATAAILAIDSRNFQPLRWLPTLNSVQAMITNVQTCVPSVPGWLVISTLYTALSLLCKRISPWSIPTQHLVLARSEYGHRNDQGLGVHYFEEYCYSRRIPIFEQFTSSVVRRGCAEGIIDSTRCRWHRNCASGCHWSNLEASQSDAWAKRISSELWGTSIKHSMPSALTTRLILCTSSTTSFLVCKPLAISRSLPVFRLTRKLRSPRYPRLVGWMSLIFADYSAMQWQSTSSANLVRTMSRIQQHPDF